MSQGEVAIVQLKVQSSEQGIAVALGAHEFKKIMNKMKLGLEFQFSRTFDHLRAWGEVDMSQVIPKTLSLQIPF